jgi:hypothetical protein
MFVHDAAGEPHRDWVVAGMRADAAARGVLGDDVLFGPVGRLAPRVSWFGGSATGRPAGTRFRLASASPTSSGLSIGAAASLRLLSGGG